MANWLMGHDYGDSPMWKRPESGVLILSPRQFQSLRDALDRRVGDGTRETGEWLRTHGFDASTFAYKETAIQVDWGAE